MSRAPSPAGRLAPDAGRSDLGLDALSVAALAYLGLPTLLFLAGWTRAPYALGAAALLALAAAATLRDGAARMALPLSSGALLAAAALALAWSAFGGAGHFFYANFDWLVRDAVFADLVATPWPPAYGGSAEEPLLLRTALGYFLPAAALGKLLGMGAAELALYAWTAAGAFLFLALLPLPRRAAGIALALGIAVAFSGMDLLGKVMESGWPRAADHLEWWSRAFELQYSSMTTQLFWAPNHALPAWLAAALFYRHWANARNDAFLVLATVLTFAWTPFAALGMAPFLLLLAAHRLKEGRARRLPWSVIGAAAAMGWLVGRYYALDLSGVALEPTAQALATPSANHSFALEYLKFLVFELSILLLGLALTLRHSATLLLAGGALLLALPFLRLGPANDLMMRASIPALVLLLALALRAIEALPGGSLEAPGLLLATALCIGAATPAYEFWRALGHERWRPDYSRTLRDVAKGSMPNYLGKLDRADVRAFLRPPVPVEQRR